MKRILLMALVVCLCAAIVLPVALADGCGGYAETCMVLTPLCTETTTVTTTYGYYQLTTVEHQGGCPPAPCEPCQPEPCGPSPCAKKKAVDDACKTINKFTRKVLDKLDYRLEGSGWVRIKNSKRTLLKSGRCIYTITVKNLDSGEKISCFMVARTGRSVVRDALANGPTGCCPCRWCNKEHECSEYSVMFVWDYNTGCNAAEYEDEWYITEYGQSASAAVCEFVTKLVNDEVCRW